MTRKPTAFAKTSPAPATQPVKRAAVYARLSVAAGQENDFSSIDAQQDACEGYIKCQAHAGWQLVPQRFQDNGFTGGNLDRPAFRRLVAEIDAGRIDVVVVHRVDRISRSLMDFAGVMARFNEAGVAFVSVTQNFDTSSAMGRLSLNVLMSFAEFEREMIGERTRDKVAASRKRGLWTGGRLPLGYDAVEKRLVINQLEALLVREIFALYQEHRSALSVARDLDARGRKTKTGQPWTKDAVLHVLRCALVAGYMPLGDQLHEGEHEAIVDRDTFARVQTLLDDNTGTRESHGRNGDYLLRGLLRCGCCNHAYTPATARKDGKTYRYYRCCTKDDGGKGACPARPLPAPAIEAFVIDRIREVAADADLVAAVTARLGARIAERRAALETERRELPKAIAALSAQGRQLMDAIADAAPGAKRLLDGRLEEVGARLNQHQARLAVVERELVAVGAAEAEGVWVARALADFGALWDLMTQENRGRLVRALVHQVVVDEPAGSVTVALADLGAGVGTDPADPGGEAAEHGDEADDEAGIDGEEKVA